MHLFDSMRRHSRNDKAKRAAQTASVPNPPSPRLPLVPHTNLYYSSSQSSLLSGDSPTASSSRVSSLKSREDLPLIVKTSPTRHGRTERPNPMSSLRDPPSTSTATPGQSSSQRSTYSSHPDLYTHNDLKSFSFGLATSAVSIRSVDPLSRDDQDSDECRYKSDTTPRPSVAQPSQPPPIPNAAVPMSPRKPATSPHRRRRGSTASNNTFGASSASASATSLSSNGPFNSKHGGSTTTPHTSANEFTSDDEGTHLHPVSTPAASDAYQFIESDEYDDYDDYEDRDGSGPDIDISSEIHEDSDRFTIFNNQSRDSFQSNFPPRGSSALPIPAPSIFEAREDDNIINLRRPSRSLEDLHTSGFVIAQSVRNAENFPTMHTPTSMPESEVDWRDVRRRSIQKEKDSLRSKDNQAVAQASAAVQPPPSSALDGFTPWSFDPTQGITGIEWDQSEMQDIVGGFQGPSSSDRAYRRDSSSTTTSGRRLSTTSTNSDPFTRKLNQWGGQQYIDERQKWTYSREKADRLEESRTIGIHERERNSITSLFGTRSLIHSSSSTIGGSNTSFQDQGSPFKEKERSRLQKDKAKDSQPWRGMALDSEEWWSSYLNGRYRVIRKSYPSSNSTKPDSQRISITHHRTPYSFKRDLSDGPVATIHKHSKATAFSIGRYYRNKPKPGPAGRPSTSSRPVAPSGKKETNTMILLANKKVQEAYTSTLTTRRLDSHGHLDDKVRQHVNPWESDRWDKADRERRERKHREAEKEKQKAKELKSQDSSRREKKDKGKSKSLPLVNSEENSTIGSVINEYSSAPRPASSHATASSSRLSNDYSVRSGLTNSSDRTVVGLSRSGRDDLFDDDEDDGIDDDDYVGRKVASKTTHQEIYGTLPPDQLESLALQQDRHAPSFPWWSKHRSTPAPMPQNIHQPYIPPWPVQYKHHLEHRKGIVEDLNTSFQDVGLLPALDELKGSGAARRKQRHQRNMPSKNSNRLPVEAPNVFHSFSSEYLYMLLPLWPHDTDQASAAKAPFQVPRIPVEARQYLLVYYKPDDDYPMDRERKSSSKQSRSRGSPTSSRDSTREKGLLYEKFHFCARIVTNSDIQGSGVRSPDPGLSVLGPVQEAYDTMPLHALIDTFQVIGVCTSRERGVEFVPEGLEKLGLTRRIPDPNCVKPPEQPESSRYSIRSEEADEPTDFLVVLTPIGRAVVEMCWLGAMALTSFGPDS